MAVQPVEVVIEHHPPRPEIRLITWDAPVGRWLQKMHLHQHAGDSSAPCDVDVVITIIVLVMGIVFVVVGFTIVPSLQRQLK